MNCPEKSSWLVRLQAVDVEFADPTIRCVATSSADIHLSVRDGGDSKTSRHCLLYRPRLGSYSRVLWPNSLGSPEDYARASGGRDCGTTRDRAARSWKEW